MPIATGRAFVQVDAPDRFKNYLLDNAKGLAEFTW